MSPCLWVQLVLTIAIKNKNLDSFIVPRKKKKSAVSLLYFLLGYCLVYSGLSALVMHEDTLKK